MAFCPSLSSFSSKMEPHTFLSPRGSHNSTPFTCNVSSFAAVGEHNQDVENRDSIQNCLRKHILWNRRPFATIFSITIKEHDIRNNQSHHTGCTQVPKLYLTVWVSLSPHLMCANLCTHTHTHVPYPHRPLRKHVSVFLAVSMSATISAAQRG